MAASRTLRILAGLGLALVLWIGAVPPAATAAPGQVMVEYGGTLEAGAKATRRDQAAAPDDSFTMDDVRRIAEENLPFIIVGVGAVLLMGTWRWATR